MAGRGYASARRHRVMIFAPTPSFNKNIRVLSMRIHLIGGVQIQNRASVGGNLCNASPAADSIPALIVHEAVCNIAGPNGRRRLPVEEFCIAPGKMRCRRANSLSPSTSPHPGKNSAPGICASSRATKWISPWSARAHRWLLDDDGRRFVSARIALGAVAPTPLLVSAAGAYLAGKEITRENIKEAARLAQALAKPIIRPARHSGTSQASLRCARGTGTRYSDRNAQEVNMPNKVHITATINGEEVEFLCEPRQSLLEVLRETLGLTGTKEGCNNGNCGACTVLLDGVLVNSCLVLAVEIQGRSVTTIEGIATHRRASSLAAIILEDAALQCGICTPGFIVAGKALLDQNPNPSEHEVRQCWRAICAAARATTRSCAPCWTRPMVRLAVTRGRPRGAQATRKVFRLRD